MRYLKEQTRSHGLKEWMQDVAALASVAAMGWTVLLWSEIAKTSMVG